MNDTIKILNAHRSIRKYKNQPIEAKKIKAIIEAAQWSATSSHFQAYTIIRIEDPEKRKEIADLAGGQKCVEESPLFLVFCADLQRSKKYWPGLDSEILGNTEMLIMATVDATLAAQKALIAAQLLGLGGVFIGGIRNDLEKVSALLKLPDLVYPVFGMCLGYPGEDQPQKPRLPVDVIFKQDIYDDEKDQVLIDDYEDQVRSYYQNRDSDLNDETWSKRSAAYMMAKPRPDVGPYLRKKGFGLR